MTLLDLLRRWTEVRPDRTAFRFVRSDETVVDEVSYADLYRRSSVAACAVRERVEPGGRALLLFDTEPGFVYAFLGCQAAGVVAVPADPPHGRRAWGGIERIVGDCTPSTILTTSTLERRWQAQLADITARGCQVTILEDRPDELAPEPAAPSGSSVAFLQYTSGSTSHPKGVMVTHDNIIANVRMIQEAFELDGDTQTVSWLPLFHDMGLIGFVLVPIYLGCTSTILGAAAFLEQPVRWLRAITRYRGTISSAPNFAYDLCATKIQPEERSGLELSSWGCALNGSEPISARTLARFQDTFAPHGFRPDAFRLCYGMAEATLLVSATGSRAPVQLLSPLDTPDAGGSTDAEFTIAMRQVVGCGHGWQAADTRVVDPVTRVECPEGHVGEVWLRGPHVAAGYWAHSKTTKEVFGAQLDGDPGRADFLRTGDLGCLDQGQLFLMGRLKELVIIRGQNYLPRYIEEVVGDAHPAIRDGHVVAVGLVAEGGEELGVVAEVDREHWRSVDIGEVLKSVREAIHAELGIPAGIVTLLRPGGLPKTTSGKLRRVECRRRLAGDDGTREWTVLREWRRPVLAAAAPSAAIVAPRPDGLDQDEAIERLLVWLRGRLAQVLECSPDQIADEEPFSSFGLDSAVAVTLTAELADWLQIELDPTIFWEYSHPLALSGYLAERLVERTGALVADP